MRTIVLPAAALVVVATATAGLAAPQHAGRPVDAGPPATGVTLEPLGRYETGVFDESAAEIVAHDPGTQTLFVVNAQAGALDVLDVADPSEPTLLGTVQSSVEGGAANSVAVSRGLVAVAVAADDRVDDGSLELYRAADVVAALRSGDDVASLAVLTLGANPDMVTFTPNGRTILVANEGEPNDDYTIDPVGSVSVVDLPGNLDRLGQDDVRTAGFEAFDDAPEGVRVFGPGASVAQDLEPEYVAVTPDGRTAFVALQENNALAVLDVRRATITDLLPLGTKDHSLAANALDASNRDDEINITTWPVNGLYLPDAIATYRVRGTDYVVTANEGDARDYDGFSEEARVGDLDLCPDAFPDAATLQLDENLGRLNITTTLGQRDGDDCFEELFSYGARSFSIFDGDGNLVFDSGDEFERTIAGLVTAGELPATAFNANNDETPSFDARSDDKGPEPEAVALGRIDGRTYAFIGLERIGGIMVYDVTDPTSPGFLDYVTTRDFTVELDPDAVTDESLSAAGDLGPEGLAFIDARDSPTGRPLLAVGHEVSGTTVLFDVVPLVD